MQTVLITGANRGVGLALAGSYAARGDTVIATARTPDGATALRRIDALSIATTGVFEDYSGQPYAF